MKIYDAFNFFNELDLLELRLNILDPYVDYFVIVEASVTHSGQPKRFYFEENRNRYERFQAKIINYKIYDTPVDFVNLPSTTDKALQQVYEFIRTQTKRFDRATQLDFGRDFFQKESVRRALIHCNDDDLIIFSDADEIPNPNVLRTIHELDLGHIYSLRQNTYYYYLNVLKQNDWYGSKLLTYEKVKKLSLNEVRGDGALSLKVDDGGWHFSFLGGREHVLQKLLAYCHNDMVNQNVIEQLERNIAEDIDPFFRSRLKKVQIDESYPEYIRNNQKKYAHLIKP